jgi:hypothetical protein
MSSTLDTDVRVRLYRDFVRDGRAPSAEQLGARMQLPVAEIRAAWERLAAGKAIVLQPESREILMANPLCAVATPYLVRWEDRYLFASCVWDGLVKLAGRWGRRRKTSWSPAAPGGRGAQAARRSRSRFARAKRILDRARPAHAGIAFKLAVYYLGIPAANHAPFPVTRMRSTGLAQVFGGAGESLSLMRKSPFTSS